MAEILIKRISVTNPDPEKDERGCYKRGYPVVIMPDGHEWGAEEGPPNFVVIKVPGVSKATLEQYLASHVRRVQFNVLSSDLPNDSFGLEIVATNPSVSGRGRITRVMVETFLNRWNLTVTDFTTNSVKFTAVIFDAIRSAGFWKVPTTGQVVFVEQSYNSGSGIHRVSADYSATSVDSTTVVPLVTDRGGTVVSHNPATKVIVFDISRVTVRNQFQEEVRSRVELNVSRRQFRVNEATVASAESTGSLTTNLATLQAAVVDKLTE